MTRAAAVVAAACLGTLACSTTARRGLPPPATAARVDLGRYAGTGYEIASFPARFQRGCTATRATHMPLGRAAAQGYDVGRLVRTPQS